ncbi:unnamed protein product [Dibothriocephalus latus]|uniref:Uncharacterized protein n=1 Tax=Dibothriocephalus latus TaxID=60516 RepID=A0A3P7LQD1_DIBLA|nr:unnamed protein product [Dibothriocephalus latus]
MTELSDKSPILKLTYDQFTELVRGVPRNYSVFSMLTALSDQRKCHSCHPSGADFLDISRSGFSAETLARWIFSRSSVEIPIVRQTSYAGGILLLIITGLVGTMLYLRPDNVEFIIHRSTISYASMVLIFYMISGQVWNSIRRPPFFHSPPQGGIAFLYPGGDFQFISETILVMITYVLVSISILMLVEAGQTEDFGKKRLTFTKRNLGQARKK